MYAYQAEDIKMYFNNPNVERDTIPCLMKSRRWMGNLKVNIMVAKWLSEWINE